MDWIFDHIQLLFVIAGGVAYWLNQRRQAQAGEEAAPPKEATFGDPELAERTRRIREEIQRKIEQRARGYANEQPTLPRNELAEPPPILREVVVKQQPAQAVLRRTASHLESQRMAEILEQQAALEEQLKQAQEMKAAALRRTQFETEVASKEEAAVAAVRSALGDDLRDPASLRRAFILREVLGPPVALR